MADADQPLSSGRRVRKSPGAFRTISEVASDLDVSQHVLRFWESKFNQVRPLKRGGGRRYYRPEDVELLRRIRSLLYDDSYTIKGVQKVLRDNNRKEPARLAVAAGPSAPTASLDRAQRRQIEAAVKELTRLRDLLRRHG